MNQNIRERVKGFINYENEDEISFDLWGGEQIYQKKNKKYRIERSCGIFSNVTVAIYGIYLIYMLGYEIEKIEIIMKDYFYEIDAYQIIFETNNEILKFDSFKDYDLIFFLENCLPSNVGLGLANWTTKESTKFNFNLEITDIILNKFFIPNKNVLNLYKEMVYKKNIEDNDYVFIWARKTDKIEEISIPEVSTYINILEKNNFLNKKIILQTDDFSVFEEFKNSGIKFEIFEEIPFAKGYSFHRDISKTNDLDFYNTYKISKENYFIQMLCVLLLAKNAKNSIIYPGNPTTLVPMYKRTFEGCFLFKNKTELF